jgi:glycosyltransferase involved in cell wall biosynthesis
MSSNISAAYATLWSLTSRRATLPRVLYALHLDRGKKYNSLDEQVSLLDQHFKAEGSRFLPLFVGDPNADVSQFQHRGFDARCLELRRFSWRSLIALRQLISDYRIDLIHWNFTAPLRNRYFGALSILAPHVRHWFTANNSRLFAPLALPVGPRKFARRFLLRRYSRVLCVSRYVQECLEAQGVWSNLVGVRHFINTERFRPDDGARQQLRTSLKVGARFVVLTAGQLIPEKGIDVAVHALTELPASVVLWVVGSGPEEKALRQLTDNLRLGDRVHFLGSQDNVQPFLQAADCFVCPSRRDEAEDLVNLEAQACGTPVLASRIGSIPEYIRDGRSGLLFAANAPHELARCVRRLVEDAQLRDHFAREARNYALEEFAPAARMAEWLELYRHWKEAL